MSGVALADYPVIGVAPDLSEAEFVAILLKAGSPALAAAPAVYAYCAHRGASPAFLLAMFRQESGFGKAGTATVTHSWGNTRLPVHGGVTPVRLTTPQEARSGQFPVFKDWIDGGIATVARWLDYAPYAGKPTVRQIIPTWAPASDGNSPEGYIAAVLASIEQWTKGAPPVALAKPAVVSRPSPNRNGYGSPHEPQCVVWHITDGSGASALSWLTNPASQASSNYVIMEDGTIYELVPPTESAWANGAVNKPNMANPVVAAAINAKRNVNTVSISVEHAGKPGVPLTTAQVVASERLTAWLCQRFGIAPDRAHIIPHAFIDSVNRPHCPGFSEAEWAARVVAIAALVKGSSPPPATADPIVARSYINGKGQPVTEIHWGGQAVEVLGTDYVDIGVTVKNAAGQTFHRSILNGQGQQYIEED